MFITISNAVARLQFSDIKEENIRENTRDYLNQQGEAIIGSVVNRGCAVELRSQGRTYQLHPVASGTKNSTLDTAECDYRFERSYSLREKIGRFFSAIRNLFQDSNKQTNAEYFTENLYAFRNSQYSLEQTDGTPALFFPDISEVFHVSDSDVQIREKIEDKKEKEKEIKIETGEEIVENTSSTDSEADASEDDITIGFEEMSISPPNKPATLLLSHDDAAIFTKTNETEKSLNIKLRNLHARLVAWKNTITWNDETEVQIEIKRPGADSLLYSVKKGGGTKDDPVLVVAPPPPSEQQPVGYWDRFLGMFTGTSSNGVNLESAEGIKQLAIQLTETLNAPNAELFIHSMRAKPLPQSSAINPGETQLIPYVKLSLTTNNWSDQAQGRKQRQDDINEINTWLNSHSWQENLRAQIIIPTNDESKPLTFIVHKSQDHYLFSLDMRNTAYEQNLAYPDTERDAAIDIGRGLMFAIGELTILDRQTADGMHSTSDSALLSPAAPLSNQGERLAHLDR